jgi:hypothetical protein
MSSSRQSHPEQPRWLNGLISHLSPALSSVSTPAVSGACTPSIRVCRTTPNLSASSLPTLKSVVNCRSSKPGPIRPSADYRSSAMDGPLRGGTGGGRANRDSGGTVKDTGTKLRGLKMGRICSLWREMGAEWGGSVWGVRRHADFLYCFFVYSARMKTTNLLGGAIEKIMGFRQHSCNILNKWQIHYYIIGNLIEAYNQYLLFYATVWT